MILCEINKKIKTHQEINSTHTYTLTQTSKQHPSERIQQQPKIFIICTYYIILKMIDECKKIMSFFFAACLYLLYRTRDTRQKYVNL